MQILPLLRSSRLVILHCLCAGLLGLLAAAGIVNTVYNNSHEYGATLHDSTIWPLLMWRNDWALSMSGALGNASFYNTHVSPIHYLPVLLSYVYPGNWLSYYGLVYALVFAALVIACYRLLIQQTARPVAVVLAGLGTVLFFFSQSVFQGAWEMHMEFFSPLLVLLMFQNWQLRRYKSALVWLLLNAAVREDIAAINAAILTLLVAAQWLDARIDYPLLAKERLRWGCLLIGVSLVYTVAAFVAQKYFFHPFVQDMYFPKDDPFGHITGELLQHRLAVIFSTRSGLWLPIVVLIAGAAVLRDKQLLAAPLGVLPYWLVFFFAKFEGGGIMDTYRPFAFVILLLWPALMAIGQPRASRRRYRYMWLQAIVLVAGISYLDHFFFSTVKGRFWPQPMAYNNAQYQRFGARLPLLQQEGVVRASHGVLALYPYQFPAWYLSNIADLKPDEAKKVSVFLWFENDRDQALVDAVLKQGTFEYYPVPGTKIHIAHRRLANDTEL